MAVLGTRLAAVVRRHLVNLIGRPLCEQTMGFGFIAMGLWLLVWPHAIKLGTFREMLELFGELQWAVIFLIIGGGRVVAAGADGGRWPLIRSILSGLSACVLVQMIVASSLNVHPGGTPSLAIPLYSVLVIAEFRAVYRALHRG